MGGKALAVSGNNKKQALLDQSQGIPKQIELLQKQIDELKSQIQINPVPKGDTGVTGSPGIAKIRVEAKIFNPQGSGCCGSGIASCSSGETLIGGGYKIPDGGVNAVNLVASVATRASNGNNWEIHWTTSGDKPEAKTQRGLYPLFPFARAFWTRYKQGPDRLAIVTDVTDVTANNSR